MQVGEHLIFERRYSSASLASTPLGNGWSSDISMSLQEVRLEGAVGAAEMLAKRPNGDVLSFNIASEEPQSLSFGSRLVLKRSIDSSGAQVGWKLYVGGNRVEYYDLQGVWRSLMVDGVVVVTAERDTAGRIARLVDHTGRAIAVAYSDGRISSITDGAQHRVDYQYDSSGRLTAAEYGASSAAPTARTYLYEDSRFPNALTGILDESGVRFASWTYDDSLRGVSSSHGGLSSAIDLTRLQYNADGSTTITNPLGGQNTYTFTASKGVVQLAGSDERWPMCGIEARSKTYDDNGYPDVIQAFGGELTDSDYSARGLEVRRSESSSDGTVLRTVETDWHPEFPLPEQTRTLNEQGVLVAANSTHYDAMGRADLLRSTDPQSGSNRDTTYAYCEKADMEAGACPVIGQLIRTTGPRTDVSQVWSNTYYAADDPNCAANGASCAFRKGDLWKEVNPLGQVVEYLSYDGAGRVLAQKDANGVLTSFTYHPRGWLASRRVHGASAADDRLTQIEYWPTGLTKRIVEPDGSSISYRYDSAHRLVEVSDNTGNHVQYVLDNAGNRVAENTRDPGGALKRTLSRLYNTLGELVTQADASANPTDYTYDSNGNATTVTDALGRVSRSDYDPLNRLKRSLQDVGGIEAEVQYRYDALDSLVEVTDPKGLKTQYARNAFGEVVTQTSPDTGVTAMTYDAAGNMATRTDARGVTATYQYDALNRVTHISYPDPTLNVAYTYDIAPAVCAANEQFNRGRVGTVIHAGGSTQYCHDRFGQLTRKVQTVNGVATTVRCGYTAGGRLAALTYPDGTVADYLRDSLGRISEVGVTRPGQARQVVVTNVTYAPFGPATGWTYGNGRALQRPVDQDYRTIAVHDPAPGGLSVGYGYDAVGEITELTNGDGTEVLAQYSYDALGRLTQTKDGATGTPIETYGYDATGNRTELTTNAGTHVYSYPVDSHRLAAVDDETRGYDASGNTLNTGTREFVYNDANRMRQVVLAGSEAENYVYNHQGERIRRAPVLGDALTAMYDEVGKWLGNYSGTGAASQQSIWLDDFPVALMSSDSMGGPGLMHIQPDQTGTPRVVVEPARDVVVWEWSSKGEAFGNQSPKADPDNDGVLFGLAMRYPGQQATEASGLIYNYQREYDAVVGRFSQSDPTGLEGGISTYGYVGGNPISGVDPDGLQARYLPRPNYPVGGGYDSGYGYGDGAYGSGTGSSSGVSAAAQLGLQFGSPSNWLAPNGFNQSFFGGMVRKAFSSSSASSSVSWPDRKKNFYVCFCRANRDGRSADNCSIDDQQSAIGYGYGFTMNEAKRMAEKDAKEKLGAKSTHHIQCRCRAPNGDRVIPHG